MNPPTSLNLAPLDTSTIDVLIDFLEVPIGTLEVIENLTWATGGSTLGLVRKENQDRYLLARYSHPEPHRNFSVAIIADGVGSLSESGLAASAAIATFLASLITQMDRRGTAEKTWFWQRALLEATQQANAYVYRRLNERGASTLSAVVMPTDHPPCAIHVGDSKIFGLAHEKMFSSSQLSVDQTVGSELQSLGMPNATDAGRDPRLDRSLAQYMGMPEDLQPQFFTIEDQWTSVLLSTDGIATAKKVMGDDGWGLMFRNAKSRADFVRKALFFCNWLGGGDNCSIIVLSRPETAAIGAARRRSAGLSVHSGARSMELRERIVASSTKVVITPQPEFTTSERKRQRGGKYRRTSKARNSDRKSDINAGKSSAKTNPSITFLPGLVKDENALRNP